MARYKPNDYIDLSEWSPKDFLPILVRYCNSILGNKVLFGSDWPMTMPERWVAGFDGIDITDAVHSDIVKHNAARLLGLQ